MISPRNGLKAAAGVLLCLLFSTVPGVGPGPRPALASDPPKKILSAKIHLRVQWNDEENRHSGQLQISVQGKLRLNPAFSSSEQGPFKEGTEEVSMKGAMLPYIADGMRGSFQFQETKETNDCVETYNQSGSFPVDPYPGPGNLMLHYMGGIADQIAEYKAMAPAGAFDALIDRYVFAVTLPPQEVTGLRVCSDKQETISKEILGGNKIQVHFPFNDDGSMRGHRTWSSDFSHPSAHVSVADLPDVFRAKQFSPARDASGDITYDLRWEIKAPNLARILLLSEPSPGKTVWRDITDTEAEIIVGKRIRLKGAVLPKGKVKEPVGDWSLEGDSEGEEDPYFKKYDADIHHGRVIPLDPKDLKQQHQISLFWSGGERGTVTFSTQVDGETLEAAADLKVRRPRFDVTVEAKQTASIGKAYPGAELNRDCMGSGAHGAATSHACWLQYDGIRFVAENLDRGDINGKTQWVQILLHSNHCENFDDRLCSLFKLKTESLDHCYPYQRGPEAKDLPGVPLGDRKERPMVKEHEWDDGTTTEGVLRSTTILHDCRMVLMFRPEGKKADTEWVPIKEILWQWKARAVFDPWRPDSWFVESAVAPEHPEAEDTQRFPEWEFNSADNNSYSWENACKVRGMPSVKRRGQW